MIKNNNNNTPYLRKKISPTLFAFSAIALLLLASPLLLSNILLQPVQAQTTLSFKTPIPANGTGYALGGALTFDAQGDTFRSSDQLETTGTYTITDISTGINSSGSIIGVHGCCLSNPSNGDKITLDALQGSSSIFIDTSCSTSANNNISLQNEGGEILDFSGPVECSSSSSSQGGGNTSTTTVQPSSSLTGTTTTTQDRDSNSRDGDGDGDGIPDSSDKCPNNSHHRCFKEGDNSNDSTSTISSNQQQPQPLQSSSNGSGNQTR
jgi:hypothetical protein